MSSIVEKARMLKIDLRLGESISIGNAIVTLEYKSGQMAKLSIEADKSVPISRLAKDSSAVATVAKGGITRSA